MVVVGVLDTALVGLGDGWSSKVLGEREAVEEDGAKRAAAEVLCGERCTVVARLMPLSNTGARDMCGW